MILENAMVAPLISVIIPVFNTPPEYLSRCVSSVINQSYENIAVLLIDDGSSEPTKSYCWELLQVDSRIKLYRQDNQGASSARNLGLEEAEGDYITFVDSDDELLEGALERLLSLAELEKADVVCAQYSEMKSGLFLSSEDRPEVISGADAAVRLLYGRQLPTGPVAKLFRRTTLQGHEFDPSFSIAEDLHFNFHVLCTSNKVLIDKSVLYWYNTSIPTSATRGDFKPQRMDGLRSLRAIRSSFYARESIEIWKAVQYRLYMEAIFTLLAIWDRKAYPTYWQECLRAMQETRWRCLSNSEVKISDKLFVVISLVSARSTVYLYAFKRRLKARSQ